ncbi:MAG: hypothetical protein BGO49_03290 [Planctomycetales bacterium 71-10]|nr:MAG: hypothetical protein BGO49_03290 [Planctomycetales bacterium 71-10]
MPALCMFAFATGAANAGLVVTSLPETSATYPVGTNWDGYIPQSTDPLAPFSDTSVLFRGYLQGGSSETLNGAHLIYRFQLDFDAPSQITEITLTGAAFNGPNSVVRLLDANRNVLATFNTFGGNNYVTMSFSVAASPTATRFFLDEFDTSQNYRYRQYIGVSYTTAAVPEPTSLALAGMGMLGMLGYGLRRRKASA